MCVTTLACSQGKSTQCPSMRMGVRRGLCCTQSQAPAAALLPVPLPASLCCCHRHAHRCTTVEAVSPADAEVEAASLAVPTEGSKSDAEVEAASLAVPTEGSTSAHGDRRRFVPAAGGGLSMPKTSGSPNGTSMMWETSESSSASGT